MGMIGLGEVFILLLTLLGLLLFARSAEGALPRSHDGPFPYAGPSQKRKSIEATRLASASAILLGSRYRRRVLDLARDRFHACLPEFDLDFGAVLRVCRWAEDREMRYDVAIAAGAVLTWLLVAGGRPILAAITALLLTATLFSKHFAQRFRLSRHFARDRYDPARVERQFPVVLSADEQRGLPSADQNLWVYGGFAPFEAAGIEMGTWSFVVNARQPRRDGFQTEPARAFTTQEVLAAIQERIESIGHPGLQCRDFLVMHGRNLPNLVSAAPDGSWRGVQHTEVAGNGAFENSSEDRARTYKCIQLHDWGGELVVSSFLSCSRIGDEVYVECGHHLLTALDGAYRKVDALTNSTWWTGVRWLTLRLVLVPWDVLSSCFWLLYRPLSALPRLLELDEWWERIIMADEPRYNYGAASSLRQSMSGRVYTHHFQRTDERMLHKMLDERILDALVEFLEEHGVDTSDIKEHQKVILNQGIIAYGGDVKAQTLAVGYGAAASRGILGRIRRKREARVAQPA